MSRSFRFMHAADLHLGSPFTGLTDVSPTIRKQLQDSVYSAFTRMVELAIREQVDFIVLSGDIFDDADRSLRAQLRFQQSAQTLKSAGISIYMIHGNHDPLDGTIATITMPDNVHLFGSDEVQKRTARTREGVEVAHIYGISYKSRHVDDNLAARFPVVDDHDGFYHLALLHTNVDAHPSFRNYAPCSRRDLLRTRMNYWALGHIHLRQTLHQSPWIVYPGNIQGRHRNEMGVKGVYIVDVADNKTTTLTFHATNKIEWIERTIDITDLHTEQQWLDQTNAIWQEIAAELKGNSAVLRLICAGKGELHQQLTNEGWREEWLLELRNDQELRAMNGHPFVWPESLHVRSSAQMTLDIGQLRQGDHFLGEVLRAASADKARLQSGDLENEAWEPLLSNYKLSQFVGEISPEERIDWIEEAERFVIDLLADASLEGRTEDEN